MLFAVTCHQNSEPPLSLPHVPFAPKSGCNFYLHLGNTPAPSEMGHGRCRQHTTKFSFSPSQGRKAQYVGTASKFLKRGQLRVLFRANVASASLLNKQGCWGKKREFISGVSATKSGLCVHERETERGLPPWDMRVSTNLFTHLHSNLCINLIWGFFEWLS